MSGAVLEMRLRVPLQSFALDISCSTDQRVVGLFGPSGSGKTTWLEAIAGLRRDASGYLRCGESVWLDGERGIDLPPERRGVGYVPQEHLLFPHRNVRENLEAGLSRAVAKGDDVVFVFGEVVRVLELEPLLQRNIATLSGGERQRAALGRALCSGPELLVLDEPLASLDFDLRRRVLPFLLRVRDSFEVPILIVSHNPVELLALCDEVFALRAGRIVARGTPTDVFTQSSVYPTAAEEGFENVLRAKVVGHRDELTVLQLGEEGGGQQIRVPRANHPTGTPLTVGIRADDILVATRRLRGISARNSLAASIERIETIDHRRILTARLEHTGGPAIVIELTKDAVRELTLTTGGGLWLFIKSSSIIVYG